MDDVTERDAHAIAEKEARVRDNLVKLRSAYRTGQADRNELIDLVAKAMGQRSQRAFALAIGVNVSSISRILSGSISEVSDKLLAKIAAYAAPYSGVTIEKLMAAQGMVEADSRQDLARKTSEKCRRLLADELLKRGYTVSYLTLQSNDCSEKYDIGIKTDALPKGDGRWLLETQVNSNLARQTNMATVLDGWFARAMAVYYRGNQVGRVSLLVDDRNVYEEMKMILERQPIKDEISVILISMGRERTLAEFVAPLEDGSLPAFVFGEE